MKGDQSKGDITDSYVTNKNYIQLQVCKERIMWPSRNKKEDLLYDGEGEVWNVTKGSG